MEGAHSQRRHQPWHTFAVGARFALSASCAWLAALLFEATSMPGWLVRLPPRAGYLGELAITCSVLWLPALGALHGLRAVLARARVRRADALLGASIAAALALPAYRRAQLLTGGTGMLEMGAELPIRIGITIALVAGYVAVWLAHLALCRVPAEAGAREPFFGRAGARIVAVACGAGALFGFTYAANEQLRAYAFLVSFVMPGAWLLGASLWFGCMVRSRHRPTWTALSVAFVAGSAAYGVEAPAEVRHAKTELIRRGGLAAFSEAARRFAPPPAYASVRFDPERPARCPPAPEPRQRATALALEPERRRHVILISIDALRRDALGRTRDGRPVTPALDALAAKSLRFDRAVTPYPATLFALSGALTGLHPSELLLAPAALADVLQQTANRWDTRVAVWPNAVWFRKRALSRLITRHLDASLLPGAELQTDRMIEELGAARRRGERTFAWIHYYEPHQTFAREGRAHGGGPRERYDALLGTMDRQVGRLAQALEKLGYLDDSLIVVFGDHGEALGELGYYGHHVYLNHFIGDIPLFVHAPGLQAGSNERVASIIDIAPTILEWTGTPAGALATDAVSLFQLAASPEERFGLSEAFPVRGKLLFELVREPVRSPAALANRLALVQSGTADYQPKVALVSSRHRLIVNRVTGDEEFYDRVADPTEQHDLSERGLPQQQLMRAELAAAVQRMSERIHCRVARRSRAANGLVAAPRRDVP